jgi:hypothetical protein
VSYETIHNTLATNISHAESPRPAPVAANAITCPAERRAEHDLGKYVQRFMNGYNVAMAVPPTARRCEIAEEEDRMSATASNTEERKRSHSLIVCAPSTMRARRRARRDSDHVVIDHATGGAHDDGSQSEDDDERQRWSACRSNPECSERRPTAAVSQRADQRIRRM